MKTRHKLGKADGFPSRQAMQNRVKSGEIVRFRRDFLDGSAGFGKGWKKTNEL
jgi:hypothetical protein